MVFGIDENMFPIQWLIEQDAKARSLPANRIDSSRRMIEKAMSKYPASLLKDNLQRVYVVGELSFSGIFAAGTNVADRIFIECRGIPDDELEDTFHHEFSSILLRNFESTFPIDEWNSLNPSSFHYGGSAIESVKQSRASMTFDDELHEQGFLHEYAQSSLEEDFNSIASCLFLGNPELWKVAHDYERVGKKVSLTIDFFHMLSDTFSESYFAGVIRRDATR